MVPAVTMDTYDDVITWLNQSFAGSGGVFGDPSCGNGACDAPLELPSWRLQVRSFVCSFTGGMRMVMLNTFASLGGIVHGCAKHP